MRKLADTHAEEIRKYTDFDLEKIEKMTYLWEFDREVQTKAWGYPTENAYYRDASSVDLVMGIRIPYLAINSTDDPVSLPRFPQSSCIQLQFSADTHPRPDLRRGSSPLRRNQVEPLHSPLHHVARRPPRLVRDRRWSLAQQAGMSFPPLTYSPPVYSQAKTYFRWSTFSTTWPLKPSSTTSRPAPRRTARFSTRVPSSTPSAARWQCLWSNSNIL